MKKIWLGSSWKMNKTQSDVVRYCEFIKPYLSAVDVELQTFLVPPFPYVKQVGSSLAETGCLTGVQNVGFESAGPFTGEISVGMAKDIGATLVEIGHSERREWFGETDATVNKKVKLSLLEGLKPLICVGDTIDEKRWGVTAESISRQVKIALHTVSADLVSQVIIAYEPVWAIGERGLPATTEEAEHGLSAVRLALIELYGKTIAEKVPLLYGGSVNIHNAKMLLRQQNIDGLFVGRTAWHPEGLLRLIRLASEVIEEQAYA
ncbi:triose-phosphate isomerase [Vibrio astriarenae]|uniref:Triosephosphate isomerase n=1 Tax=Vibrio astriarenae TaxID=1481923 RepID=A0A7Z2T3V9_9VIBR|nr:triose-phosphate isomerase [Vibrio astriarenae]QIA63899.1 triose-phosphate isomerase [Vibrio astriarenae]